MRFVWPSRLSGCRSPSERLRDLIGKTSASEHEVPIGRIPDCVGKIRIQLVTKQIPIGRLPRCGSPPSDA